jgi:disulfide bond formation protein DsbB
MFKKITKNILTLNLLEKTILLLKLSFFISTTMLLSALYLQYFKNLPPCDLCITQRWFHVLILLYSLTIYIIIKIKNLPLTLVILGLVLVWISSGLAGMYHFGIELKLWTGPEACSSNLIFSKDLLKNLLSKSPIKCDEIMFSIIGISLAGWNTIISSIISLFLSLTLIKKGLLKP